MKIRADQRLMELGIADSLPRARALLLGGKVFLGEARIDKAGALLEANAPLRVTGMRRYVSRGGEKLAGALATFGLKVSGWVSADLGASTGGFTDCLLQHGAARVFAVDVGKGLLDRKLLTDARVTVMDGRNARDLVREDFPEALDLVTVDVSFIGIAKISAALARILLPGRALLAMVKPQFEVSEAEAARGRGVIRDPAVREAAILEACQVLEVAGFAIQQRCDSELKGPKGNVEHFVFALKH